MKAITLEQAEAQATQGEWTFFKRRKSRIGSIDSDNGLISEDVDKSDASLICHYRTHFRALVEVISEAVKDAEKAVNPSARLVNYAECKSTLAAANQVKIGE